MKRFREYLWGIIPHIKTCDWDIIHFFQEDDEDFAYVHNGELYFPIELYHEIMKFYYDHDAFPLDVWDPTGTTHRFLMFNNDRKKFASDLCILIVKDDLDES